MEKVFVGQRKSGRSMTKIVWTLGPESRSVERIEKLLEAGMNVARFNFSYGSREYHQETLDNLRTAVQNTRLLCAVMLDTKGREVRTGDLVDGKPIELKEGQELTISVDYTVKGDSNMISISYKKLAERVKPGDTSLGLVRCRCDNFSLLGEREKVHLPGIDVDLPILTEEDKKDILEWGVPNKINIIALSFVHKGSDLDKVKEWLGKRGKNIMLMAKVENEEGVANVYDILEKTDAVMVARGDLSLEMSPRWILTAQKRMIKKANVLGKPVVTAIQMPDSTSSSRPTTAEATDVATAVLEGTDCVMLSGVTGADPETVVQTMSRLCKEAEDSINYSVLHVRIRRAVGRLLTKVDRTIACAVTAVVYDTAATAIVVVAKGGYKAEFVAKFRPSVPIVWVVDRECPHSEAHVASRGLVYRGIIPVMGSGALKSTEELITFGVEAARDEGICKVGDVVLVLQLLARCPAIVPVLVKKS